VPSAGLFTHDARRIARVFGDLRVVEPGGRKAGDRVPLCLLREIPLLFVADRKKEKEY
jgi:hypothetical protein